METVHLRINSKEAYEDLLQFLKKFGKQELELISDSNFEKTKMALSAELKAIDNGGSELVEIDEYDTYLDKVIAEYED